MPRKVSTAIFGGLAWSIRSQAGLKPPDVGECRYDKRTIKVPIGGDTLPELEWTIHEALHAAFPWMREWMVDRVSGELSRFLWRLGWRKADD